MKNESSTGLLTYLVSSYNSQTLVILEGQVDIQFIIDAFNKISFQNYKIILIHAVGE
ncbi:MAG: hypothetical protein K0R14_707 [Burkholderiales bacterium]|jgi:hypothetical protein|nr:hypothetical protein [Burkholderiales bacterium]